MSWTAEREAKIKGELASPIAPGSHFGWALDHLRAAMLEIERLRAEREHWLESADQHITLTERAQAREAQVLRERDAAEAECKRLRGELEAKAKRKERK